jgi:hypothetical protein
LKLACGPTALKGDCAGQKNVNKASPFIRVGPEDELNAELLPQKFCSTIHERFSETHTTNPDGLLDDKPPRRWCHPQLRSH